MGPNGDVGTDHQILLYSWTNCSAYLLVSTSILMSVTTCKSIDACNIWYDVCLGQHFLKVKFWLFIRAHSLLINYYKIIISRTYLAINVLCKPNYGGKTHQTLFVEHSFTQIDLSAENVSMKYFISCSFLNKQVWDIAHM